MQAAIGQKVSAEELGGAAMHSAISGTVDFREPNDEACLNTHSRARGEMGIPPPVSLGRRKPVDPHLPPKRFTASSMSSPGKPYDMREIIARVVDGSRFDEYKPEYGKTILCGYARIGGFAVGIVANRSCTHSRLITKGKEAGVWRRDLHRVRRKGRPLHHGL